MNVAEEVIAKLKQKKKLEKVISPFLSSTKPRKWKLAGLLLLYYQRCEMWDVRGWCLWYGPVQADTGQI